MTTALDPASHPLGIVTISDRASTGVYVDCPVRPSNRSIDAGLRALGAPSIGWCPMSNRLSRRRL
jgi:hypothetical protein